MTQVSFSLPSLPYAYDALVPYISAQTLHTHHTKHHQAYVDGVNRLALPAHRDFSLVDLIRDQESNTDDRRLFNNAAQMWNHTFYWHSLAPKGQGQALIGSSFDQQVQALYGGYEGLSHAVVQEGLGQFASGWVWLARDVQGRLVLTKTGNGEVIWGQKGLHPVWICDVWEHAYYLDYQSARAEYLTAVTQNLANWAFAAAQFQRDDLFAGV